MHLRLTETLNVLQPRQHEERHRSHAIISVTGCTPERLCFRFEIPPGAGLDFIFMATLDFLVLHQLSRGGNKSI